MPLGPADWREVVGNMCKEAVYPLDISHPQLESGEYNFEEIESATPIKTWEDWISLPLRPYDEYVLTTKGPVRLPSVVICAEYNKIRFNRTLFPTKKNIWDRDAYTCGYTGVRLNKDDLSIDHIIPKSRGGGNTWENLITANKEINRVKADRTPQEAGLKLLWRPTKPSYKNVLTFDCSRPEWVKFLP